MKRNHFNFPKNGEWFSEKSKDIVEVSNNSSSGNMGCTMLKIVEIENDSKAKRVWGNVK